jgi:ComF family protein
MFITLKRELSSILNNTIIPDSDCLLCKEQVKSSDPLSKLICQYCHSRLPVLQNGCSICAMPMFDQTITSSLNTCGACLKQAPNYSKTVAAFHYESPISDFITSLKFNGQHHFVPLLSQYLHLKIKQHYQQPQLPEAIIPVPLHPSKIRERGFNQALLIAQSLSTKLNIPLVKNQIKRTRYTKAQSALDAIQRQRNLKDAFSVCPVNFNKVAIIDDVMTTGATANELSRSLLKAGVNQVDVWCVARAFSI